MSNAVFSIQRLFGADWTSSFSSTTRRDMRGRYGMRPTRFSELSREDYAFQGPRGTRCWVEKSNWGGPHKRLCGEV